MNADVYRGPWGGANCRDSLAQVNNNCLLLNLFSHSFKISYSFIQLIQSFIYWYSIIHCLFIHFLSCSFAQFIYVFIHSLNHSLIPSFIPFFVRPSVCQFIQTIIHSFTYQFMNSHIYTCAFSHQLKDMYLFIYLLLVLFRQHDRATVPQVRQSFQPKNVL